MSTRESPASFLTTPITFAFVTPSVYVFVPKVTVVLTVTEILVFTVNVSVAANNTVGSDIVSL